MSEDLKSIQLNVKQDTYNVIGILSTWFSINKADVVTLSLKVLMILKEAKRNGKRIEVVDQQGDRESLILLGENE